MPAAAQVQHKPLPLALGEFAYVPHGPVLPPEADGESWRAALGSLERWARAQGCAVLKLELDVLAGRSDVRGALERLGWQPSAEAIQFPNTMRTDLTPSPDELLGAMKSKTRYNIRLAARRGVRVAPSSDLDTFFDLYSETARRDGFAIRARDYYLDAWGTWLAAGRGALWLAERDGVVLAGALPVQVGAVAYFMYGASATAGRRHMAAYAVQWACIQWARERGCAVYDWWGGPTTLDPADPLWGVYRFKLGFGAAQTERLGPWDLGLRRAGWWAYRWGSRARRWRLT